ncbi:glycoside hydrolase family 3 protein [Pseudobutyrivibrio sp.]|uniref:glycoside hydrolase family 3 protein n=1 Tax=Pseudobutyrivibrio sp. TaxID=2014367 RepID=UPI001B1CC5ED|nr:glycoside hydrolase family 3 protein [Pseudobutyrivibrio sp.]MBO5618180.1 glycoside hydrolase family 3 protein [Pseudobutyrivibrio sp.]MBP3261871.1 glycoside hydrolase family 3 protein [Pseudobutyrivibrio sp.]
MADKIFDTEQFAKVAREAVAEGVVLLKNENKVLPLAKGSKIALFGRSQFNYYKSGTGSGGMVNTSYVIGLYEAIIKDEYFQLNKELRATYENWIKDNPFDAGAGWAAEPWFQKEMPITKELADSTSKESDVAVVLIGRTAGEDQDNSNAKGSYLLTDDEEQMLENVTKAFDKTIVLLNVGNIIDMKWVEKYNPAAVAYIWQGGQEGGNGVIDVLKGVVSPSGKLTDTIAYDIEDYPSTKNFGSNKRNIQQEDIYVGYRYFETFAKDRVLYPFGFGLSYTYFDIISNGFDVEAGKVTVSVTVTNIGDYKGKQVVQAYVAKPQGKLGKPVLELVGFAKTKELKADESETLDIVFTNYQMASYDDSGVTGFKSAYVLEEGTYIFYVGDSVRNLTRVGTYNVGKTKVVEQLSEALAPTIDFTRIKPESRDDGFAISYEDVPNATVNWQEARLANLQTPLAKSNTTYKLVDVLDEKCTLDEFVAQLSDEELCAIVRGEGMSSPKVTPGCGGAFGGVTESLVEKGIPTCCCTDGPSGIRMDSGKKAFAMPNGTLLACMWNLDLTEELYNYEGLELRKNKIDILLGPGMNLHRNPLNGRNFEYFSEDPLVTGKNAAAQLKGMHKYGVTGTIKHFAMNTQEAYRHSVEHVASERAIREIYLKGFEIAVKEAGASAVMTTYGSINGYYTSSSYDLVTKILREEWGFEGIVMTDWWAKGGKATSGDSSDMASIVRAQNDLYMVTQSAIDNTNKDNLEKALLDGTLDRAELQRCAKNICKYVMGTPTFLRFIERNNELDIALSNEADDDELDIDKIIDCRIDETGIQAIDAGLIETARNSNNIVSVSFKERGDYKLTMRVRSKATSDLAQIPLSIFKDKELVKMVTLTGADRDWQDVEVMFENCAMTFFLRMYFAQDGMEIEDIKISLAKSKEEEIRLMFARMGE